MKGHNAQVKLVIKGRSLGLALAVFCLWPVPALAIPGQSIRFAETWIRANPTLQPGPGERFLIQRRSTPAQRFTFEASVFPVTGITENTDATQIRTERFLLVDSINGMTPERLDESLRAIYGVEVFNDYRQAVPVLAYPLPGVAAGSPNPAVIFQGELREGEQFAYWQELVYDQTGTATSGRMVVFLKEDLPRLTEQLTRDRLVVE